MTRTRFASVAFGLGLMLVLVSAGCSGGADPSDLGVNGAFTLTSEWLTDYQSVLTTFPPSPEVADTPYRLEFTPTSGEYSGDRYTTNAHWEPGATVTTEGPGDFGGVYYTVRVPFENVLYDPETQYRVELVQGGCVTHPSVPCIRLAAGVLEPPPFEDFELDVRLDQTWDESSGSSDELLFSWDTDAGDTQGDTASPSPSPPPTLHPTPSATEAPASEVSPTEEPSPEPGLEVLRFDGLGPFTISMSRDEATRLATGDFVSGDYEISGPGCYTGRWKSLPGGVGFMFLGDQLARVDVYKGSVVTETGLGIGSPETEVRNVYAGRLEVSRHVYVPGGHYLVVRSDTPGEENLALLFETDGESVINFRSGELGAVGAVEGCF